MFHSKNHVLIDFRNRKSHHQDNMKLIINGATTEQFVKRAFYLLWKACGGPTGNGFFQDRGEVGEDAVWNNVQNSGDYPGGSSWVRSGRPYGDYVFGRMMKWGCEYDAINTVTIRDQEYRPDYQAWCGKYKTPQAIVDAVCESLKCTVELVKE